MRRWCQICECPRGGAPDRNQHAKAGLNPTAKKADRLRLTQPDLSRMLKGHS